MEDRFTLICLLPFTMSGIGPIWAPWQRRDPSYPSSTSGLGGTRSANASMMFAILRGANALAR